VLEAGTGFAVDIAPAPDIGPAPVDTGPALAVDTGLAPADIGSAPVDIGQPVVDFGLADSGPRPDKIDRPDSPGTAVPML
jgi:hypothetical protein